MEEEEEDILAITDNRYPDPHPTSRIRDSSLTIPSLSSSMEWACICGARPEKKDLLGKNIFSHQT